MSNETHRYLYMRAQVAEARRRYVQISPSAFRAVDSAWWRESKRDESIVFVAPLARAVRRINAPFDAAARLRATLGVHRRSGPPPGQLAARSPRLTRGPTDRKQIRFHDPLAGLVCA